MTDAPAAVRAMRRADRQLLGRLGADAVGGPRHRLDHDACASRPSRSPTRRSRCCKTFADQAVIAIQNARLFKRDAGSARRGRGRQRGQELVPRDDEPRDPHADERGHRHERAAARHAAQRRAARLRGDDPRLAATRCSRSSTTSSTSRRSRPAAWTSRRSRSTCANASSRRSTSSSARATEKHLDIAYVFEGDVPAGDPRRRHAAAADPAQPAVQRGEVHRAGRGRAHGDRKPRDGRRGRAHLRRARHRHRAVAGGHGPAVPVVLAGRLVDHAQVRRHRPGARDQQAAGRADGRHACGPRATGPGKGSTFHFTIRAPVAELPPRTPARLHRRAAGAARASACWSSTTTPPTGACSTLQTAKWGMVPRDTESPQRGAALARSGRAVRPRDPRHAHAGDGRRRSSAQRIRDSRPDAAAGALQLARPARGGRHRQACSAPTWPSRCASRSCSTRWSACSRTSAAPQGGRAAAKPKIDPRWRRAIRCASCSPRTTS